MATRAERGIILQLYEQWQRGLAASQGATGEIFSQYEAANPLYMSVDGIMRYWRKKAKQA
jgi:hypothetical protein